MILKKPYAFLIKYFRIIHILLALLLLYLTVKVTNVVSIFNQYVSSGISNSLGIQAGSVISFYMYLVVVLIIGLTIIIYILLKKKEKPYKFYIYLMCYYLLIFILLTLAFGALKNFEIQVIDLKIIRAYRDIALIVSLPQYFFLIYTIIRAIGFDIKKFNFSKDLDELEIGEEDREEFELAINLDGYKVKRKARRTIRELKYYAIENPFVFVIVGALVLIVVISSFYINRRVYSKVYNEEQTFTMNNLKISIEDSFLTSLDYNGKEITKNKYYLIIKMKIENKIKYKTELLLTDFRIRINNKNILPTLNKNEYFIDIATPYNNQKITGLSTNDYLIVYELSENQLKDKYELRIEEDINYLKGEIIAKYKKVKIKPAYDDELVKISENVLAEEVNFKKSNLKMTTLKLINPVYTKNYTYNYNFCYKNKCQQSTNIIDATYQTEKNKILLVFDYDLNIDVNTSYAKNTKLKSEFFEKFLELKYIYNNKEVTVKPIVKKGEGLDNKLVLETDYEVNEASDLKMIYTIRNKEYYIDLK